jgi:hypothetical protein
MLKALLGGVAASALLALATPAMANGQGGGGGNNSPSTSFNANGTIGTSQGMTFDATKSVTIAFDNTISASSGSGFGGDITVGNLGGTGCGCVNVANFSGSGSAGSVVGGFNGETYGGSGGLAGSYSWSEGAFTASTQGFALVEGQVMNYGQSEFTQSLTVDITKTSDLHLDSSELTNTNWEFETTSNGNSGGWGNW